MLQLRCYEDSDYNKWDEFITNSENGTIFHKLAFLQYHGDKFKQAAHNLVWEKSNSIHVGLPLAIFDNNSRKIAKSPYGASWGGFVIKKDLSLKNAIFIVENLLSYLNKLGVKEIIITPTPQPYYKKEYSAFIEFALINNGFKLINRDVIHVIDLNKNEDVWNILHSKCRNQVRKGSEHFQIKAGVKVEDIYSVFKNDKIRLGATMAHSQDDLNYLSKELNVASFDIAIDTKDNSKAGICYFNCNERAVLTFYMAQEEAAKGKNGLNYLILEGMFRFKNKGVRFFDFGTSSIGGKVNNIGISEFKESFGATGFFRDTYKYSFE